MNEKAWKLILKVARKSGYRPQVLLGPDRTHSVSEARRTVIRALRDKLKMSWPEIGDIFSRHPTTCMQLAGAVVRKARPRAARKTERQLSIPGTEA